MTPPRAVHIVQQRRVRAQVARDKDSGPWRPAMTLAEPVLLHRERIRLSQTHKPQRSRSVAGSSSLRQSRIPLFHVTVAAMVVENETASSTATRRSQTTAESRSTKPHLEQISHKSVYNSRWNLLGL